MPGAQDGRLVRGSSREFDRKDGVLRLAFRLGKERKAHWQEKRQSGLQRHEMSDTRSFSAPCSFSDGILENPMMRIGQGFQRME